jgi:hypothetical protein
VIDSGLIVAKRHLVTEAPTTCRGRVRTRSGKVGQSRTKSDKMNAFGQIWKKWTKQLSCLVDFQISCLDNQLLKLLKYGFQIYLFNFEAETTFSQTCHQVYRTA